MNFKINTKVRLRHTGEVGKVLALLGDDMVLVLLDEDEIPVAVEFLEPADQPVPTKVTVTKATPAPKPKAVSVPLSHEGVLLCFQPFYNQEGAITHFELHLWNDTPQAMVLDFELSFEMASPVRKNTMLSAASVLSLGTLLFDLLNDAPIVFAEAWRVHTRGSGAKESVELKLKPKQFFKKMQPVGFDEAPMYAYMLLPLNASSKKPKPKKEDLQTYTQKHQMPFKGKIPRTRHFDRHDILERAHFPTEIDLHIEQLVAATDKLTRADKLRIQLRHFDDYIGRAVRLGVERVFVIHGIGEGKLRDAIAGRLLQNPDIRSFNNDYHPRYGYGATEVLIM